MTIRDYRELAQSLDNRIRDAHDLRIWQEAADRSRVDGVGSMPPWQRDLISRLLSIDEPFDYLTFTYPESGTCRLVAFTASYIVDAKILPLAHGEYSIQSFRVRGRSDIESIRVETISSVPFESVDWPIRITLQLQLGDEDLPLPLDRYASRSNMAELVRFYPSILRSLS